ncbi:hypothetical protein [Dactylosporangium sp. CA-233914]|uniref:hypothetical protein n=1 Tax=Dactylosporangium sp. CA-233914 TaxID=3239934 RepID=UPI003D8B3AAD
MSLDSRTIASYFERIGWTYHVIDSSRVVVKYRCPIKFYYYPVTIEVVTTKHWVIVRTLLQRDVGRGQADAVLRYISQWNEQVYLLRFVIVQDCVLLQGEIPAAQCHIEAFVDLLRASCRYSALAGVEIALLATNPSAAALYTSAMASMTKVGSEALLVDADTDLDFDLGVNVLPAGISAGTGPEPEVEREPELVVSSEVG